MRLFWLTAFSPAVDELLPSVGSWEELMVLSIQATMRAGLPTNIYQLFNSISYWPALHFWEVKHQHKVIYVVITFCLWGMRKETEKSHENCDFEHTCQRAGLLQMAVLLWERERSYFEIPSLRCQVDRATYIKTQGGMAQAKHSSDSDKQIHFNLDKAKTIPHSHWCGF